MKIMWTLFASQYKFGAPDCILMPDSGHILFPVSGSIFGHRFVPLQLQTKSRAPKRGQKMEPKIRTKIGPKSGPQNAIRGPKFVRRHKQGRVEMIFSQRSAGRSDSSVHLTTSNKEGRETWAGKIAQTESINTFTDQT